MFEVPYNLVISFLSPFKLVPSLYLDILVWENAEVCPYFVSVQVNKRLTPHTYCECESLIFDHLHGSLFFEWIESSIQVQNIKNEVFIFSNPLLVSLFGPFLSCAILVYY